MVQCRGVLGPGGGNVRQRRAQHHHRARDLEREHAGDADDPVRSNARPVDRRQRIERVQHGAVQRDRHVCELANLRSGHRRPRAPARAAAIQVQVLTCRDDDSSRSGCCVRSCLRPFWRFATPPKALPLPSRVRTASRNPSSCTSVPSLGHQPEPQGLPPNSE